MNHEKFHYKTFEDVLKKEQELGVELPFASDTKILSEPLAVSGRLFANRLGSAPMEGADSTLSGSPSEFTLKRYKKVAEGGAAVIWFEAISVAEEGRSSNTQLLITDDNVDDFKKFTEEIKEAGLKKNGYAPFLILQANHSGRYSNPGNKPHPLIAYRHPWLEQFRAADDSCIVSDDYLKRTEETFGHGSELAKKAGFDAVDIKSCHGYLFQEVASAYYRPGLYGGSYENRTRLLKNSIAAAKAYEDDSFMVTSRVGIYDGYPEYCGFGQDLKTLKMDLTEPKRLIRELYAMGIRMVDLTMGNPYATTHVTRPFDGGKYPPDEHPFEGLDRMIHGIGVVKKAVPEMVIYASAPTYLRQYSDLYAAGAIESGLCDGMLFGRMQFADPDFANEIIKNGRIDPKRVCLTCGMCGDLIRAHKPTGCVVRDRETFMPFYQEFLEEKKSLPKNYRG